MCDGATLTKNGSNRYIDSDSNGSASLVIYGQNAGTGTLDIAYISNYNGSITINGGKIDVKGNGDDENDAYISSTNNSVIINGGTVNVNNTSTSNNAYIKGKSSVTINGGQITVDSPAGDTGIHGPDGLITLGYTSADDFIKAPGYYKNSIGGGANTPKIADGKIFVNADNTSTQYSGTLTANAIDGIKLIPLTYIMKFDTNNGSGTMSDQKFPYGIAQTLTANAFTRDGAAFKGWNTKADGSGTNYTDGQDISSLVTNYGEMTLYAQWSLNSYTITYDLDGGTASNPESYTIETESFTLNNPAKDGYTFTGWTGTDLTIATQTVTIAKGSTGDREYTANYSENQQDQEQEQKQESQITLSAIDVSVTGALTLTVTEGEAKTSAYTASVKGTYSDGTSKTLDANDYSIEWTLDKNISGIQISNNGTLSINDSVKAGEYSLTITAKAAQDNIKASGTSTVSQQELTTLEALNVSITGSDSPYTTEGEALTSTYTAGVKGTYSDGSSKTLDENISGIAINNRTLSVSEAALQGEYSLTITATATQGSITASGVKNITLNVYKRKETTDASSLNSMSKEEKEAIEYLSLSNNPNNKITDLSQIDFTDFTNLNTLDLSGLKNKVFRKHV